MQHKGLNAYRQTEVQSRTPLELVVMLYDGALRFTAQASEATARGDIRARGVATSRLLAIISELQSTLDLERGGEVAVSLDSLYAFMTRRVMDASMSNTTAPLDEVRSLLETLRDGWQGLAATGGAPPASAARTGV